MDAYWQSPERFRDQPRLQTPQVWLGLRRILDELLKQPDSMAALTPLEEFLLYTATNFYELGWQESGHPHWPYHERYTRSAQRIRESVANRNRNTFGLRAIDANTAEMLALLCMLVGQADLTHLKDHQAFARYLPLARLDYLAALLQLADWLMIDRANNTHISEMLPLDPRNITDARFALQPYARCILKNNTITLNLWIHPDDGRFLNTMRDLFLEPVYQWLAHNSAWMANEFHFVLNLNQPITGVTEGWPPDPLGTSCKVLLPFLETFQPAKIPSIEPFPSRIAPPPAPTKVPRTKVFICHHPKDKRELNRLNTQLAYFATRGLLEVQDASKLMPGSLWRKEIENAIASAKVAILLVSADFMASRFIAENQLAPLLAAAQTEDATIIPVLLSPSGFEESSLSQFSPANDPSRPFTRMSRYEKDETCRIVARIVKQVILGSNTHESGNQQHIPPVVAAPPAMVKENIAAHHKEVENALPSGSPGFEEAPLVLQVGQKLWNQYQIVKIAGKTAHSQVVKAWDEALQRDVAIKFFYLSQNYTVERANQLRRFLLREARILVKMRHQNIAEVYHVIPSAPAMVMQWVEGQSLQDIFLDEEEMPVADIIKIGIILSDALQHIHEKGIVHRDIKPNNIILTEQNERIPILVDFDIARSLHMETITRQEDGSFAYVGNPSYSAPEQFTSPATVGPPADIFALGVVLYEAFTHELPFFWGNSPKKYNGYLPIPERNAIPDQCYTLLCMLLQQQPERRPDAFQLKKQLQALMDFAN
ncbi:protein kinase domain-containing protein [Reticulibacter mediterranei]|nr:protein kinase [Reticulibacter mediterranei]